MTVFKDPTTSLGLKRKCDFCFQGPYDIIGKTN